MSRVFVLTSIMSDEAMLNDATSTMMLTHDEHDGPLDVEGLEQSGVHLLPVDQDSLALKLRLQRRENLRGRLSGSSVCTSIIPTSSPISRRS